MILITYTYEHDMCLSIGGERNSKASLNFLTPGDILARSSSSVFLDAFPERTITFVDVTSRDWNDQFSLE